jgi:hypothetical protein
MDLLFAGRSQPASLCLPGGECLDLQNVDSGKSSHQPERQCKYLGVSASESPTSQGSSPGIITESPWCNQTSAFVVKIRSICRGYFLIRNNLISFHRLHKMQNLSIESVDCSHEHLSIFCLSCSRLPSCYPNSMLQLWRCLPVLLVALTHQLNATGWMDTASYCCAVRTEAHHPDSAHERGRSKGAESGEQLFSMHLQQGAHWRPLIDLRPGCVRTNLGSGRGLYLWQVFVNKCALELNRGISNFVAHHVVSFRGCRTT